MTLLNAHLAPVITPEIYAKAIDTLMPVAFDTNLQSKPCAMVLLNAYTPNAFNLDITGFVFLDKELYAASLVIIRARIELAITPDEVNRSGFLFSELWSLWRHCRIGGAL